MARTKASAGAKVSKGQKGSSRPAPVQSERAKPSSSKSSRSSGNPYCPRETPDWQRPITNFFTLTDSAKGDVDEGASSSSRPKKKRPNVIDSDSETENAENGVAEESIEVKEVDLDQSTDLDQSLPPLVDDNSSHKIKEYFAGAKSKPSQESHAAAGSSSKNKGVGKSSNKQSEGAKDKENLKPNVAEIVSEPGTSNKRSLDSVIDDSLGREVKRVKL